VIYTPIVRQFAVDLAQLSGPAVARWFDPSSGTYTSVAGSPFTNNGTAMFVPPGSNNDGDGGWVLAIETNPPPGVVTPPAPIRPKFVQQNYATPQTPQSQVSTAYFQAQTAGNANILAIGWNDTSASIASVNDSAGNAYQVATGTFRGNGLSQAIYACPNIKAASNNAVTVHFTQPATFVDLRVTEYSGLAPTNAFEAGATGTGVSDSASTGPITLTATNALLFGAGMTSTTFAGAGLGFTERVITSPDGDLVEDQVAGTLGPFSATASLGSGAWLMQLAAFKPALPRAPALRLFLTPTNTVIAAWQGAGFRLQQNPGLATAGWSDVTNAVGSDNGQNQVVLMPLFTQRFYRLKYP
jgi:hypothetical protein